MKKYLVYGEKVDGELFKHYSFYQSSKALRADYESKGITVLKVSECEGEWDKIVTDLTSYMTDADYGEVAIAAVVGCLK